MIRQVELAALSGWQTVLITLGASALTGAAALIVSWVNGRQETARLDRQLDHERDQQSERIQHERDEQWRDRLTDAAADFSTGVQQALLRVHEAIQVVGAPPIESHSVREARAEAAIGEAERTIGEAIARVARVTLVFGEVSSAAGLAEDVVRQLEATLNEVKPSPGRNTAAAWHGLSEAYELHKRFNQAARNAIRQQPLEDEDLDLSG
jgi:hypothetical protein